MWWLSINVYKVPSFGYDLHIFTSNASMGSTVNKCTFPSGAECSYVVGYGDHIHFPVSDTIEVTFTWVVAGLILGIRVIEWSIFIVCS